MFLLLLDKFRADTVDIDVSEWADVGGSKERKMTYVMHMVHLPMITLSLCR